MGLQSRLFRGDQQLEAAAVSDPAHIVPGAKGPHVTKIQQALIQLDGAAVDADGSYGPATAAAVLAYKHKRDIVNRSYQTKADDIVGRMTVAAMDRELLAREVVPPDRYVCRLYYACPPDAGGRSTRGGMTTLPLVRVADTPPGAPDVASVIAEARRVSKQSVWDAAGDLRGLLAALRATGPMSADNERTFRTAVRWLNLDPADRGVCAMHIDAARLLMLRIHGLKTSNGGDVVVTHAPGQRYHGESYGSPDLGMKCGDPFFNPDGPNCRRDVVTHEFFHMIGVHHGGGALDGSSNRSAITTPAQALDSADNLTQLVAELRTFKSPNTDACTRAGD